MLEWWNWNSIMKPVNSESDFEIAAIENMQQQLEDDPEDNAEMQE